MRSNCNRTPDFLLNDEVAAAAAAKSLLSCPTLCDPRDAMYFSTCFIYISTWDSHHKSMGLASLL